MATLRDDKSNSISISGARSKNHHQLDRNHAREKAMQMKMDENLRRAICIRIQTRFRKNPEVAGQIATVVMQRIKQESRSGDPTDEDLVELVRDAIENHMQQPNQEAMIKSTTRKEGDTLPQTSRNVLGSIHSSQYSTSKLASSRSQRHQSTSSRRGGSRGKVIPHAFMTEAQKQQASIGFKATPRISEGQRPKNDIWNDMAEHDRMADQEEKLKKKEQKLDLRKRWMEDLEAQKQEKARQASMEKQLNERYYEETLKQLEMENEREKKKEWDRAQEARMQQMTQQEQRDSLRQAQRQEAELQALEDQRMLERIVAQKKEEEERRLRLKQQEKLKMERVLLENSKEIEEKKKAKLKDREYDAQLAKDYIAMEEAKEASRQAGLEEMSKRIQAKMKFFNDTSKADQLQREQNEAMRNLRYQQEHEEKVMAEEQRKKERQAEKDREQRAFLAQQMVWKKEREDREKEEMLKQSKVWKQELKDVEKKEKQKEMERKQQYKQQHELLRQQMKQNEALKLCKDQTPLEVELNKSLLLRIQQAKEETQQQVVDATKSRSEQLSRQLHKKETSRHKQMMKQLNRKKESHREG